MLQLENNKHWIVVVRILKIFDFEIFYQVQIKKIKIMGSIVSNFEKQTIR